MTFRMDKLTIKGQEAVVEAQSLATSVGNPEIEGLHLLTALLKDNEGVVVPLLKKMGAPLEKNPIVLRKRNAAIAAKFWWAASLG